MTTYRVSVNDRTYKVDVANNGLFINGELVDVNLTPLNQIGLYLLKGADKARELFIRACGRSEYAVTVNGRNVIARVEKNNGQLKKSEEAVSKGDLVAPMPGMVVNVLVEEGQEVNTGDILVVMESMKMQMQLRAPLPGKVARVNAQNRTQVEKGVLLVRINGSEA